MVVNVLQQNSDDERPLQKALKLATFELFTSPHKILSPDSVRVKDFKVSNSLRTFEVKSF